MVFASGGSSGGCRQNGWLGLTGALAGTLTCAITGAGAVAHAFASGRGVRWRLRVAVGYWSSRGPTLVQVRKLTGVLVRCPKCGRPACVPYSEFQSRYSRGGDYLKCRSCHEKTYIGAQALAALLRDVLSASDMQDLLDHQGLTPGRRAAPAGGYTVPAFNPYRRRASTKGLLIAFLVFVLIVGGGATYLILAHNPGHGFFGPP